MDAFCIDYYGRYEKLLADKSIEDWLVLSYSTEFLSIVMISGHELVCDFTWQR